MPDKNKPLTLSVIIPAYNEESNIVACLESIAGQTVMPDEVLLVDNNCNDRTIFLAKKFSFVTVINESKQGIVYARNRGFNFAKSDIIGRIDADTVLPTDWVQKVKKYYSDTSAKNTAITGGGYFTNLIFPPASINSLILDLISFRFNRLIMGHYILWGSNMAMQRNDWLKIKQNVCKQTDIHEDLDLAIHLHKNGVKIQYIYSLKVGVKMKRVLDNWSEVFPNLMWWPRTLRRHGNWRWVFGLIGALILLIFSVFVLLTNRPLIRLKKGYKGLFRKPATES